jgi:uncharacterized protein (TIGR03435 family)
MLAIVFAVAAPAAALCQQHPAAFEAASIKPAGPATIGGRRNDASHVHFDYYQLISLIRTAWHVDPYQVIGPEWLSYDHDKSHWDVEATIPDGESPKKVPEMVATLLAERFGLVSHEELRSMPVYVLTAGKDPPRLRKSQIAVGADGVPDPTLSITSTPRGLDLKRVTVSFFARELGGYVGRPVLDKTGIGGKYDFSLRFDASLSASASEEKGEPPAGSIFAVVKDMGFKLERRNEPVKVIVIDHIEHTPTPN